MPQNPTPAQSRMPVLFVGHGSPMNAIEDNLWSQGFADLADMVPEPTAVLCISAHWFVPGTFVTGNSSPRTIHDFGGFPRALYEVQYPAPGKPDLAEQIKALLDPQRAVGVSQEWGLDHGAWSVLRRMYPQAQVPVVQLSIDSRLPPSDHYHLARSLLDLRYQGVLIVGSGNVTHNLRDAMTQMRAQTPVTPTWAARFDGAVANALRQRDTTTLLRLWPDTDDGRMAHPSPDHFLPLIYAYGASDDKDTTRFTSEAFEYGSLSMRNVLFG